MQKSFGFQPSKIKYIYFSQDKSSSPRLTFFQISSSSGVTTGWHNAKGPGPVEARNLGT
jgi:hypothetical protein